MYIFVVVIKLQVILIFKIYINMDYYSSLAVHFFGEGKVRIKT